MPRTARLSLLPLLGLSALAAAGCGGGGAKLGGGREGAAQAVYQATQVSGRGSGQARQGLNGAALEVSTSCTHGGTAALRLDTAAAPTDPSSPAFTYDVAYRGCNEDGRNTLDGTLRTALALAASTSGRIELTQHVKGRLDIRGEVDDFVDADVTVVVVVDASSQTEATVSVRMTGSITTSTERHTYAGETLRIATGALPRS
jgi:hypothetical protein